MRIINDKTKQATLIKLDQIENGENIRRTLNAINDDAILTRLNTKSNFVESVLIREKNKISIKYIPIVNTIRIFINGINYNDTCYTVDKDHKLITWVNTDFDLPVGKRVAVVYDYNYVTNGLIVIDSEEKEVIDLNEYRRKDELITEDDLNDDIIELLNDHYDDTFIRNKIAFIEKALSETALRDELLAYRKNLDKIQYEDLSDEIKDILNSASFENPYDSAVIKDIYTNLDNKADKIEMGNLSDINSQMKNFLPEDFTIVDCINYIFNHINFIETVEYGKINDSVTESETYGSITDEVTEQDSYGTLTGEVNNDA